VPTAGSRDFSPLPPNGSQAFFALLLMQDRVRPLLAESYGCLVIGVDIFIPHF
jgi:hypothetical protein